MTYAYQQLEKTPPLFSVSSKDAVVRDQLLPQPFLVNGVSLADTNAAIVVGESTQAYRRGQLGTGRTHICRLPVRAW